MLLISFLVIMTAAAFCLYATPVAYAAPKDKITECEVLDAQRAWGNGITSIGRAYQAGENYQSIAAGLVEQLYGYEDGVVLFKPTLASDVEFRGTTSEAVSYFVGGEIAEDLGFALRPWSNVRFENINIILRDGQAIAMGNYYFTDANTGEETKVNYTFGYYRDAEGQLRIHTHHSSLPYDPEA